MLHFNNWYININNCFLTHFVLQVKSQPQFTCKHYFLPEVSKNAEYFWKDILLLCLALSKTGETCSTYNNQEDDAILKRFIVKKSVLHHVFVHLGKVVEVSQAELRDVNLHWVYDREATVPLLLRAHHCVTALWWLGDDITGCKERGNGKRRYVTRIS